MARRREGGRAGGGEAGASACVAKGRPRPAGGSGRPAGVCRRGGPARLAAGSQPWNETASGRDPAAGEARAAGGELRCAARLAERQARRRATPLGLDRSPQELCWEIGEENNS